MKSLPYWKWFPADAEGDDFYVSLTDSEGWTYHRLLNRAWMNDGIPADLDELARILGRSRASIDKVWPKLSKRWIVSPRDSSKLVNPRQEEEFQAARTKSEHNKRPGNANATRSKREREPIGSLRAYDSVSKEKQEKENEEMVVGRTVPEWQQDEHFIQFRKDYMATGGAFIDEDFTEAYGWAWKKLDFEQKAARHKALIEHIERGAWDQPRFVPKPRKFIETEWKRPISPRLNRQPSPQYDMYQKYDPRGDARP